MKSLRILLIACSDILQRRLELCLSEAHIQLSVCTDIHAAELRLAEDTGFDVMILGDLPSEGMITNTLGQLQRNPHTRDIPVIPCRAEITGTQLQQWISAGAFFCLQAPLQESVCVAIVKAAFRQRLQQRNTRHTMLERSHYHRCLQQASFRFRTLEEADSIAHSIAGAFPEPYNAVHGILELMINAIEHGNLGISTSEKRTLIQDGTWRRVVDQRLASPEQRGRYATATVRIRPAYCLICINDLGEGFDWQQILHAQETREPNPNGRGLLTARLLSFDRMRYNKTGNIAYALVWRRSGSGNVMESQPLLPPSLKKRA